MMACPTCDHTMSRLGCQYSECQGTWACPRCGTLKVGHNDGRFDVIVPSLVERYREFSAFFASKSKVMLSPTAVLSIAREHGIDECVNLPANRPE